MKPPELSWEDSAALVERGILLTKSFLLSQSHGSQFGRVLRLDDLHHSRIAASPARGMPPIVAPGSARDGGLLRVVLEQAGERSLARIYVHADARMNHGNLFLETIRDLQRGIPGWFWSVEADLLSYTFPKRETIVLLPLRTMRAWVERNVDEFRRRELLRVDEYGQRNGVGCLAPTTRILTAVPGACGVSREGMTWSPLDVPERQLSRAVG